MTNEITEITNKIDALDAIRAKLEDDLLKLHEDELELDDERAWLFLKDQKLPCDRHAVA